MGGSLRGKDTTMPYAVPPGRRLATTIALVTALTLAGCSGGDEGTGKPAGSPTGQAASTSAGAGSSQSASAGAGGAVNAEAVNIDPKNLPPSLGSVTVPAVVKDDPAATMKVDLLGLKRQDKVVIATYSFVVTSTSTDDEWLWDYLGRQIWNPTLVDTKNLKLHQVLRPVGGGTEVMTTYKGSKFAPGQTYFAFAAFAAPPADVTTMTVNAVEGGAAFTDVPLK